MQGQQPLCLLVAIVDDAAYLGIDQVGRRFAIGLLLKGR